MSVFPFTAGLLSGRGTQQVNSQMLVAHQALLFTLLLLCPRLQPPRRCNDGKANSQESQALPH